MTEEPFDVIVVGAGAAGSLLAAKLAAAGKRTLVPDAGPGWTRADLVSSPIWARRLKWDPGTAATGGAQPINVGFNAGYGLGGSALHHYACWFKLHPEDFRLRSLHGRGLDWPITYDDLRPYYDWVQREVGISGDAAAELWRPAGDPYPMPPLNLTLQGRRSQRASRLRASERRQCRRQSTPWCTTTARPVCMTAGATRAARSAPLPTPSWSIFRRP